MVKPTLPIHQHPHRPLLTRLHPHSHHYGMLGEWWNNDLILDGTPESDLDRLPNDAVVQKTTYGAFNGTRLREMGVEEVVVTGVMTNLCCEATARQAFNVGRDNPTAIIKADAVCDDADTCEESFSDEPFTADNNAGKQLAAVAVRLVVILFF